LECERGGDDRTVHGNPAHDVAGIGGGDHNPRPVILIPERNVFVQVIGIYVKGILKQAMEQIHKQLSHSSVMGQNQADFHGSSF